MDGLKNEPQFITGWRLTLFKWKYALSLGKYLFNRKRYPLFSMRLMNSYRKINKIEIPKITKFQNHCYTAIMRVPRWPSRAYDHMVAHGGLNLMASGTSLKTQMDCAILGVSQRCVYNCEHCYENFNLSDRECVPIEKWKEITRELQHRGVSIVVFSGGEPMLRFEELLWLLESCDKDTSDFHIHTSGHGVTAEKAQAFKAAGLSAAGISLDHYDPFTHDGFRGYTGAYKEAVQAVRCFRESGIFPYLNVCMTKALVTSGGLWKFFEVARDLRVGVLNLLEPKPCGKYIAEDGDKLFSDEERSMVIDFFKKANRSQSYKDYPFVSYIPYYERPEHFGCLMGGLSHLYIDSRGNVQPCVYLPVSFGNIMNEDFSEISEKMKKAIPGPLHGPCPSLLLSKIIHMKKCQGISLPVPYSDIEEEWHEMVSR
ncbi:MAG: radical SAM protein [Deltaproteobacteria bacterium]|nr:radical SAM protein [Deltaproteobacteria bacterium]